MYTAVFLDPYSNWTKQTRSRKIVKIDIFEILLVWIAGF